MPVLPYKNSLPQVASGVYVDATAVVIGDVHIGEDSSIWPMCSIRGDVNSIRIGQSVNIQDNSVLHVTHPRKSVSSGAGVEGFKLEIGNEVTVGHQVVLHGCKIESQVLIGMGSIVMDGAIVRSRSLIGAGSLITEKMDVEGGYLWLGRPARRVRVLTAQEMETFAYSAAHYVRLKNDYLHNA